jgi:hypothetical protein
VLLQTEADWRPRGISGVLQNELSEENAMWQLAVLQNELPGENAGSQLAFLQNELAKVEDEKPR